MKKKLFYYTVTLCLIVGIVMIFAINASAEKLTGDCGENVTYELDTDTGVLIISGSGEMKDFGWCSAPWYSKKSYIKEVIIGEGITTVGKYAFMQCDALTKVDFPNSLETIKDSSFYYCSKLTNLDIPDGVQSIEYGAFNGCSALTELVIPDSVTEVGYGAFDGCSQVARLSLGAKLESIGDYAFRDVSVTELVIPDSVTWIGSDAFSGCESLSAITIGKNVTHIGSNAFNGDYNLEKITWSAKNVADFSSNNYVFNTNKKVTVVFDDNVETIPAYCFCTSASAYIAVPINEITIGKNVKKIGKEAFSNSARIPYVNITDLASWCEIEFGSYSSNPVYYATKFYFDGEVLEELVVPENVTKIGAYAFYGCTALTSVSVSDSVESIGEYAFAYCRQLTDLSLGESLETVGAYAFDECSALESITFEDNIFKVGEGAISDTKYFKNTMSSKVPVYLGKCLISVRPDVIGNVLTIEDGTKGIGDGAFKYYADIKTITIPDSVKHIGKSAFYSCSGVTTLYMGSGIESVDEGAFEACGKSMEVYYSGDVSDWAAIEFGNQNSNPVYNREKLYIDNKLLSGDIVISDGTMKIGSYAFYGFSGITGVTLPKTITAIGEYAFYSCNGLTDVYYLGSRGMWRKISIASSNNSLKNATMHYEIEMPGEIDVEVTQTWYNSVVIESEEIKEENKVVAIMLADGQYVHKEVEKEYGVYEVYCDGAETVKIFIWESYETMKPLCEPIEVNLY